MWQSKIVLAILYTAAAAALPSNSVAQSSATPAAPASDPTDPVEGENDQFVCCRALVFDCRYRLTRALKELREDSDEGRCVRVCLEKMRKLNC